MHGWAFRKRWGMALFGSCLAGAVAGLSLRLDPMVWLTLGALALVVMFLDAYVSRSIRWVLPFIAIALAVACFARFIEIRYDAWQSAYVRAESGMLAGRIIDVLPSGVDEVLIEIEVAIEDETSLFTKRLVHGRPLVRLVTTIPELVMMKEQDPSKDDGDPATVRWPVRLYPFQRAGNPGGFDARLWALRNGWIANAYPDVGFFDATGEYAQSAMIGPCLYGEALSLVSISSPLKSRLRQLAARWRCKLGSTDGPGAVAVGLILGQKDLIDDGLRDRMSRAGIAHLLAVSGLHVSFVLFLFVPLVRVVPIPVGSVIVMIVVFFFVSLVGGPPSAVRAGTMSVLAALARIFRRSIDSWHLIGIVGAGLILWQPFFIYDLGFQLSFLALFGIIGTGSSERRPEGPVNRRDRLKRSVGRSFIASTGAQLTTWPIVANAFSSFSWIGPLINVIAVPLAGLAIGSLLLGIVVWEILPSAGDPIISFGKGVLATLIRLAEGIGHVGAFELSMLSPLFVIGWYTMLLGWILIYSAVSRPHHAMWPRVGKKLVIFGLCLIVASYGWWLGLDLLGVVDVWVLDVGQGDSIVIKGPWNRAIIVDGGGVPGAAALGGFDVGDRVVVPTLKKLGIRRLEIVVSTHPHEDHLHGLVAVLNQREVGRLYSSESSGTGTAYRHFIEVARQRDLPIEHFTQDDVFDFGRGVTVRVLAGGTLAEWADQGGGRPNINDLSVALLLNHPSGVMALLGDLEIRGQGRLLSRSESDGLIIPDQEKDRILLIPHHGAGSSFYPPLWDAFSPDMALLSVGAYNRYNHPAPGVTAYFEERGIPVKRTDRDGAVRVRFWPWGSTVATVR